MFAHILIAVAVFGPIGSGNAVPGHSEHAGAVCPCDADVNNDSATNIIDWACIQDCKAGNCSCCISSCDVNCDGVVDDIDAGDDPQNERSMWQCQFVGHAASACCGACCDESSGTCSNDVIAGECSGNDKAWSQGLRCGEFACSALPTGACCNVSLGTCQDNFSEAACAGNGLSWTEAASCSPATCPMPPTGACCNLANGHCHDNFIEANCSGGSKIWSESLACSAVSCSVPPQDPCPCNGETNGSAPINILDVLAALDCANEDCDRCTNSCDANCDGLVDYIDMGVVACHFQQFSDCCNRPLGACINAQALPTCVVTLQSGCEVLQGTYLGNGSQCSGTDVDGIPAASEWSLIVFSLFLAVAATAIIKGLRTAGD